MWVWHRTTLLLLLTSSFLRAQLTIENPKHLEISASAAQALFANINRAIEREFHSRGSLEGTFRVRLVLGEPQERFTIDDGFGNGSVYLERWDEGKFVVSTMRLAMQHLLAPDRQKKIFEDVVRRTRETAPVSAAELRKQGTPAPTAPSDFATPDVCVASGMRGGPCITMRRPIPMPVR